MKIKDLDRSEVYSLEEIKKDSVKFDMLKEWLEKNCNKWDEFKSMRLHIWDSLNYNLTHGMWYMLNREPTKCALTLFDLDITDYQVDCSGLSKEQIDKMKTIVSELGFKVNKGNFSNVDKRMGFLYFKSDNFNEFYIGESQYNKTAITYDKFIKLFGEKIDNLEVNQGYKESDNKCNYELDFDFIKDLAMRIQNETKYEPYNWKKPMNVEQLSNAMLRHAIEVKKGNFDDNGELGHLLAIAANAMFIYYQKKIKRKTINYERIYRSNHYYKHKDVG